MTDTTKTLKIGRSQFFCQHTENFYVSGVQSPAWMVSTMRSGRIIGYIADDGRLLRAFGSPVSEARAKELLTALAPMLGVRPK